MNPALWTAIYCSQHSSYDTTQDNRRGEPETGDVYETSYWQNCTPVNVYTNSIPIIQIKNCL
jgi:hypothetical protein